MQSTRRLRARRASNRVALCFALCFAPGCFVLRPTTKPPQYPAHTHDNGLHVQDLVVPLTGHPVQMGDLVELDYAIWLASGELIDSTHDTGQPILFTIGSEPMPEGLVQGVIGMQEGGRRSLAVPPVLGFGEEGVPGQVPPHTWLVFQLELRALEPPPRQLEPAPEP